MAKKEINYINLLCDLKKVERNNTEALNSLLIRYNIQNVEFLQRKVFHYIFSINDPNLVMEFVDMLVKAKNLPIVQECYSIVESGISKDEYVTKSIRNSEEIKCILGFKYDFCISIISKSSFLQHTLSCEHKNDFLYGTMLMEKTGINYINLIYDLKKAGKFNKEEISSILYRYNITKIETLERKVLNYIFSINEDTIRFMLINKISEANNLPIITECYSLVYSGIYKNGYLPSRVKSGDYLNKRLYVRYELCMKIITQSSFLLSKQQILNKCNQSSSDNVEVRSHTCRKQAKRIVQHY